MHRRGFLTRLAALIHGLIGAVIVVPGLRFLLEPLVRKRRETGFLRVAPLSAVPEGRPTRFMVSADRWDAYTHHPPGPIGSVWLIRTENRGDGPELLCLQTICPHLGCGIEFAADRDAFSCPCHASDFDRNGKRRFGPSQRDMDQLECRVTDADPQAQRWIEVKYQAFQTGVGVKRPLA